MFVERKNGLKFVLGAALFLLYPFIVYGGLRWVSPRFLAVILLLWWGLRANFDRKQLGYLLYGFLPALIILVPVLIFGSKQILLFLPGIISFTLLLSFGKTLFFPPSMVERLARLQVSDLSSEEVNYCLQVTKIWCLFFVLNGIVSIWISFRGDFKLWTIYNGIAAYCGMGIIFAVEYLVRQWRFPRPTGYLSVAVCKCLARWRKYAL